MGTSTNWCAGELFVTPPHTDAHETVAARLSRILDPYVEEHGLRLLYHPRAVMRFAGSEVEPDLMVRALHSGVRPDWNDAPIPILIVEILSPSTRRRDQVKKRSLYMDAGVAEYWMIDPELRAITAVRAGREDVVALEHEMMRWSPDGAATELTFEVARVFG